jgi:hypothetical protein
VDDAWWHTEEFGLALSKNEALPWSLELIERFVDRWDWGFLAANKGLPWSLELIERFMDRWDWGFLAANKGLPWSLELIERYEGRWNWWGISGNKALTLPPLRPSDIVEIMEHHFPTHSPNKITGGQAQGGGNESRN